MTIPTKPGYYWYKEVGDKEFQPVWLREWVNVLWVYTIGSEIEMSVPEFNGEWGPKIEPPDPDGVLIETKEQYEKRKGAIMIDSDKLLDFLIDNFGKASISSQEAVIKAHGGRKQMIEIAAIWWEKQPHMSKEDIFVAYATAVDLGYRMGLKQAELRCCAGHGGSGYNSIFMSNHFG